MGRDRMDRWRSDGKGQALRDSGAATQPRQPRYQGPREHPRLSCRLPIPAICCVPLGYPHPLPLLPSGGAVPHDGELSYGASQPPPSSFVLPFRAWGQGTRNPGVRSVAVDSGRCSRSFGTGCTGAGTKPARVSPWRSSRMGFGGSTLGRRPSRRQVSRAGVRLGVPTAAGGRGGNRGAWRARGGACSEGLSSYPFLSS